MEELFKLEKFWSPYDTRNLLQRHIYKRCEDAIVAGNKARDNISTKEALEKRQEYVRSHFMASIGCDYDYSEPVSSSVVGSVSYAGYRVENILICPEENVYISANMYIPDGDVKKRGAVLFVCGHAVEGKHYKEYIKVCRYLVSAGLVVLAIDPTGQGERLNFYDAVKKEKLIPPCTADHDHAGLRGLMIGRNIAYYFLRDAMCAVSYLLSRPEADPAKIGVTGNSGGGTQTSMVMLADRRIAAAAPGTFIMNNAEMLRSGQAQDAEQVWHSMFSDGIDHEDILISIAPKPALVLAAEYDFFPKEGTDETVLRARRIWDICGARENLEYYTDSCFHKYSDGMALRSADFFSRHFLGKSFDGKLLECPQAEKQLCTSSGQITADFKNARNIPVENRFAREKLSHTDDTREWLSKTVFSHREIPRSVNIRPVRETQSLAGINADMYMWCSQKDLFGYGLMLSRGDNKTAPVLAIWEDGTKALKPHMGWIESMLNAGKSVFVADLSGMGQLEPYPIHPNAPLTVRYGTMYTLCTDLLRLGDSLAALRVFDVIRTLDALCALFPESKGFEVYSGGRAQIYARLAQRLDMRIKTLTSAQNPKNYGELFDTDLYDEEDILSQIIPDILMHEEI